MTEEELQKIKEHIEIHTRREPRAIKITQILWKAVKELQAIKELQKQIVQLKCDNNYLTACRLEVECTKKSLREQIEKMKCCANCWKYYRGENADDKGYLCVHHDFNDKCKLWELEE